jgi:hypothetical protein
MKAKRFTEQQIIAVFREVDKLVPHKARELASLEADTGRGPAGASAWVTAAASSDASVSVLTVSALMQGRLRRLRQMTKRSATLASWAWVHPDSPRARGRCCL